MKSGRSKFLKHLSGESVMMHLVWLGGRVVVWRGNFVQARCKACKAHLLSGKVQSWIAMVWGKKNKTYNVLEDIYGIMFSYIYVLCIHCTMDEYRKNRRPRDKESPMEFNSPSILCYAEDCCLRSHIGTIIHFDLGSIQIKLCFCFHHFKTHSIIWSYIFLKTTMQLHSRVKCY